MLLIYFPRPGFHFSIFQLFGFSSSNPWGILALDNKTNYFFNQLLLPRFFMPSDISTENLSE